MYIERKIFYGKCFLLRKQLKYYKNTNRNTQFKNYSNNDENKKKKMKKKQGQIVSYNVKLCELMKITKAKNKQFFFDFNVAFGLCSNLYINPWYIIYQK